MRGIALGGFMGTGKSVVGCRLAARLGLEFVDMDGLLADRHGSITRQFSDEGEGVFRQRERGLVSELCDGVPRVVATGGGAWVDRRNRDALRVGHLLVVLRASMKTIRSRLGAGEDRPLWSGDPERLLAQRSVAYADADLILDVDGLSVDEVVEQICAAWE